MVQIQQPNHEKYTAKAQHYTYKPAIPADSVSHINLYLVTREAPIEAGKAGTI